MRGPRQVVGRGPTIGTMKNRFYGKFIKDMVKFPILVSPSMQNRALIFRGMNLCPNLGHAIAKPFIYRPSIGSVIYHSSHVCFRDDINRAYRKLAVLLHPDKSVAPGSEDAFKLLVQARTSLLKSVR